MTLAAFVPAAVFCSRCNSRLPGEIYNFGKEFYCDNCGAKLWVEVFPSLFRGNVPVSSGETLTVDGDAGCFFHPQKKAVVLCSACGRFLCSLCETELTGKCLCPSCIDKGRQNEELETLVTQRTLFDKLALSLAVLPLLIFPVTIITSPIAIYIVIRYWKKSGSILPRTRIRFIIAFILALLQVASWVVFFISLAL